MNCATLHRPQRLLPFLTQDKHDNPVEDMITDIMHQPGYKSLVLMNGQGIVLKYDNCEVSNLVCLDCTTCLLCPLIYQPNLSNHSTTWP